MDGRVGQGRDHMMGAEDGQVEEGGVEVAKVAFLINLLAHDNLDVVSLQDGVADCKCETS